MRNKPCPHCGTTSGQHKADCLLVRQFHGEVADKYIPSMASQATAGLPLQGLSSWLHHMARQFPEDGPTLLAWAKEATAITAVPLSCRDSHEASLKYVEGFEAGRASRAQSEPVDAVPGEPVAWVDSRELGRLHESGLLRIDAWREDFLNTRQPLFAASVASRSEPVAWMQSKATDEPCVAGAERLTMTAAWKRKLLSEGYPPSTDFANSHDVPLYAASVASRAGTEPVAWRWRFLSGNDRTWRHAETMPGFDPAIVESQPLCLADVAPAAAAEPSELQLADSRIDAICAPGRAARWKGDGRQYDRDTVRLMLSALPDRERAASLVAPNFNSWLDERIDSDMLGQPITRRRSLTDAALIGAHMGWHAALATSAGEAQS